MATPDQVGTVYDIVIEDYGFILEENSYRMSPAPQLAPKVSQGAESNQDLIGELRMAKWSDFRGGIDDRYTGRPNRYYRGQNVWALEEGELKLGPRLDTVGHPYTAYTGMQPKRGWMENFENSLYQVAYAYPNTGSFASYLMRYNPASGSWSTTANWSGETIYDLKNYDGMLYAFGSTQVYRAAGNNLTIIKTQTNTGQYCHPTIYDDRVYAAGSLRAFGNSDAGSRATIYALIPGYTSFQEVATLGSPQDTIQSMAVLAGTLYIGKDDGLWAFRQNRAWKVTNIVPQSSTKNAWAAEWSNYEGMAEHQGWLYYQVQGEPARFNGASVEVLYGRHLTAPGGFWSDGDLLYTSGMDNSKAGLWVMRDLGLHNLCYDFPRPYSLGLINNEVHMVGYDSTAGRLDTKKIVWRDIKNRTPQTYATTGKLMLPWVDGGMPTWKKAYKDVMLYARYETTGQAGFSYSTGHYNISAVDSEGTVSSIATDIMPTAGRLDRLASSFISLRRLGFRGSVDIDVFSDSSHTVAPVLQLAGISYTPKPPSSFQHGLRVVCEDDLELRDGSMETLTATQLQGLLGSLSDADMVKFFGPFSRPARVCPYTWDGSATSPDYSKQVAMTNDGLSADVAGLSLAIGHYSPFNIIYIKFSSPPTDTSDLEALASVWIPAISAWSPGDAFATGSATNEGCSVMLDSTFAGGATMRQSGYVGFKYPEGHWGPCRINASYTETSTPLYWARLKIGGTPCVIDCIRLGRWVQLKHQSVTTFDLEEPRPIVSLTATEV